MNRTIDYTGLSDAELVEHIKNGEESAFNEIYSRYKGILHLHAYKKLGDFDQAKDVIQDMFVSFWNNRESIPHTQNISGYLYTITKNKVLNALAHEKIVAQYAASFSNFIDEGVYVTDLLIREKELASKIEREIDALPPKMKEVFLLSRQHDLSYKEVSTQLGITENTVKYHIKTALKSLREKLDLMVYLIILLQF